MSGGNGTDLVTYARERAPVRIRVSRYEDETTNETEPTGNPDVFGDVEGVIGGQAGDVLIGDGFSNRLIGGRGNDRIAGGKGADVIDGGDGNDSIDAFDKARDQVACGSGRDGLLADSRDAATRCEARQRGPALTVSALVLRRGQFYAIGRCSRYAVEPCAARATVTGRFRPVRLTLPVLRPGRKLNRRLRLSAAVRKTLARSRRVTLELTTTTYDGLRQALVQTCPHPNACLSCDNFLTDRSFRDVHERQLTDTRRLCQGAEEKGSLRLVEIERDEQSLTQILAGLDELETDRGCGDEEPEVDVVALAVGAPTRRRRRDSVSVERARLLRNAAAARSRHAEERTRHSLLALDERGAAISLRSSHRASERQPPISLQPPRAARRDRPPTRRPAASTLPAAGPRTASDESLRTRLRATLEDNKRLREELAELRDELALAHGRAREIEQARPADTRA